MSLEKLERHFEEKPAWTIVYVLCLFFGISLLFTPVRSFLGVANKVTDSENIIHSYEEYEQMYSTCKQLCDDISLLEESSIETTGFSKEERVLSLKNNLNRWVNEYNAKSRMITKNAWKSSSLPHQLSLQTICQ